MLISSISGGSPPAATAPAQPSPSQASNAPQKPSSSDSVTISKQAQHLAYDGDTAGQEALETAAEKSSETLWLKS